MRWFGVLAVCFTGLSAILAGVAHADALAGGADRCASVLRPDQISIKHSIAEAYAYDKASQSAQTQNDSFKGGATIPIEGVPIGMSSDAAASKSRSQIDNLGIKWSDNEKLSYLAVYTPPDARKDFVNCMARVRSSGDGGVTIEAQQAGDNNTFEVTITVHPDQAGTIYRDLEVETNGIVDESFGRRFGAGGGNRILTFRRSNPAEALIVRAQMHKPLSGTIGSAVDLVIPAPIIYREELHTSLPSTTRCGQRVPGGRGDGNSVKIDAAPDEILKPETVHALKGNTLPATTGDHPSNVPRPDSTGFQTDFSSVWEVAGNAWCIKDAHENPGYVASFTVVGVHVTKPILGPGVQPSPMHKLLTTIF